MTPDRQIERLFCPEHFDFFDFMCYLGKAQQAFTLVIIKCHSSDLK